MTSIAIVDDELQDRELLKSFFSRLARDIDTAIETYLFASGEELLLSSVSYDIICLDIQMEGQDGLAIARRIREQNEKVVLIFVTNLAHLAIEGYSVHAYDFIVKPIEYNFFVLKMESLLKAVGKDDAKYVSVMIGTEWERIPVQDLLYIEVTGHYLLYHTKENSYKQKGSLHSIETKLSSLPFAKCNNCYLVNLENVEAVQGDEVRVGDTWLKISRSKKKDFLQTLAKNIQETTI